MTTCRYNELLAGALPASNEEAVQFEALKRWELRHAATGRDCWNGAVLHLELPCLFSNLR